MEKRSEKHWREKEESEKEVGVRGDDMCSREAWGQKRCNRGEENIVWRLKGLEQRRSGGHGIKCRGQVRPPWRRRSLGKLAQHQNPACCREQKRGRAGEELMVDGSLLRGSPPVHKNLDIRTHSDPSPPEDWTTISGTVYHH